MLKIYDLTKDKIIKEIKRKLLKFVNLPKIHHDYMSDVIQNMFMAIMYKSVLKQSSDYKYIKMVFLVSELSRISI